MANITEQYKCDKCGNILSKINKFLHDLKCQPNNPLNNNNKINNINNVNLFNNNNNFNNYFNKNIENNNMYICEICNMELNSKDKADHLLCHELANNDINNDNDINFSSLSNNYIEDDLSYPNRPAQNNNIFTNSRRRSNSDDDDDENENIEEDDLDDSIHMSDGSLNLNEFDNIGLNEEIIQTYPTSKIKDVGKLTEDKKRCSICLENYKNNDDSIILPCIHIFHAECIKKWMKNKNTCPICKNKIE